MPRRSSIPPLAASGARGRAYMLAANRGGLSSAAGHTSALRRLRHCSVGWWGVAPRPNNSAPNSGDVQPPSLSSFSSSCLWLKFAAARLRALKHYLEFSFGCAEKRRLAPPLRYPVRRCVQFVSFGLRRKKAACATFVFIAVALSIVLCNRFPFCRATRRPLYTFVLPHL